MTTVLDFKPDHIKALTGEPVPGFAEHLTKCGPSFSIMVDGEILACAGLNLFPWGTNSGEAWTCLSPSFGSNLRAAWSVTQAIKSLLARSIATFKMTRVQATIREGEVKSEKWARRLGFEYETTLRGYGPMGESYKLFARVTR